MIILGEMNGLRVRTVSTSLGEWISSGNEWTQSPCHPVSGSTCPGLAIGVWCGKGTAPGCAWCLRGPCFCVVFAFLAWSCTGSPKVPSVHDLYLRDTLLALAGHGDGHILTVTVPLLLAILTGRSDLCIAGVQRRPAHAKPDFN